MGLVGRGSLIEGVYPLFFFLILEQINYYFKIRTLVSPSSIAMFEIVYFSYSRTHSIKKTFCTINSGTEVFFRRPVYYSLTVLKRGLMNLETKGEKDNGTK